MLQDLVDDLQNERDLCSVPHVANTSLRSQGAGTHTERKSGGESRGSGHNNDPRQRGNEENRDLEHTRRFDTRLMSIQTLEVETRVYHDVPVGKVRGDGLYVWNVQSNVPKMQRNTFNMLQAFQRHERAQQESVLDVLCLNSKSGYTCVCMKRKRERERETERRGGMGGEREGGREGGREGEREIHLNLT